MKDVDGPTHVQALAQPARHGGECVHNKLLRVVPRTENIDRIVGYSGRNRDLGQDLAVRTAEPKLPIRLSIEPIALLMDGAMVSATE
jgi:hypothetical protein